ncbi:PIN domain-containing protein [Marivirga sp.]|uniref:PIN domain-containing protein n=1 Tax=Marivirga sp. TaxID=2018662 RepID=UPI0025F51CF8|nr:PIN domain-containing protein [Marivirga sp.]
MKITVDSNIVFSAILNPNSSIGQILINGSKYFDFYSINYLKEEISNHSQKILKITGYSNDKFEEIYDLIITKIRFVDDVLLSDSSLKKAYKLTSDIDEDDTLFVALNNHLKSLLWTGDKVLVKGLKDKGYLRTISTSELHELLLKKKFKSKRKPKNP